MVLFSMADLPQTLPMDWDKEIEAFLDAHGFRAAHRRMMKANLMKLSPEKRTQFLKKRPEDMQTASPKPRASAPPAPSNPLVRMKIRSSNVPCEGCGSQITGMLYFIHGSHFSDGWKRGYFCSFDCLQQGFDVEHYGSPHNDFERGNVVQLMHETYLLRPDDQSDFHKAGTLFRVVSDQHFTDGSYAAGRDGDIDINWNHITVDITNGRCVYAKQYVGSLLFVRRN
jgi:hypothetical protein